MFGLTAGPWPLNSSGASVIVTVGNPLLSEFPGCTYDIEHVQTRKRTSENTIDVLNNLTRTIKENVREGYLEDIIHAHNLNKYCVNTARTKDFSYDEKKHPPGKSTVEASLKSENISELLNSINEEFSVSTGIPKQS
jgi:predicted RNA-binding protein